MWVPVQCIMLRRLPGSAASRRISFDVHTLCEFIQQQRLRPNIFLLILAVLFYASLDVVRFKGRKAASYRPVQNETSKGMGGCRFHQHNLRFQQLKIGIYQTSSWGNNWGSMMFLGKSCSQIPITSHYTYPRLSVIKSKYGRIAAIISP